MKKEMLKQYSLLGVFALIACLVVGSWASYAWYAGSRAVDAYHSTGSGKADTSLFVESGVVTNSADYKYTIEPEQYTLSGNLFPISTPDCKNWWYVSRWNEHYLAAEFTKAAPAQDEDHPDRYNYTMTVGDNTSTNTAYNLAEYTVYCNEGGLMDVYFDSEGIQVLIPAALEDDAKQLKDALRIGVTVQPQGGSETLKFVYLPVGESGTGNSIDQTEAELFCVDGVESVVSAPYTALIENTGDYSYASDSKTALFEAGYTPTVIRFYIWLEGTDAQAVLGKSDAARGINLKINLTGEPK